MTNAVVVIECRGEDEHLVEITDSELALAMPRPRDVTWVQQQELWFWGLYQKRPRKER